MRDLPLIAQKTKLTLSVTLLAALVFASPANAKSTLAVLNIKGQGVEAAMVDTVSDTITAALAKLGVFEVLSRADIMQMVQFEQDKQMLGCESDTECLAELGGALGVALLVSGSIGKVGEAYVLNLTLTDAMASRVVQREQRQIDSIEELTKEAGRAATSLVRTLLAGEQGFLILKVSEEGASIEVDGNLVGVSPLGRQALAGGPHTLKVIKKGFITWAKDIQILKGEPSVLSSDMIPSLEFVSDYENNAKQWRTFAYLSGVLAASAIGGGIGVWMWNGDRADDFTQRVNNSNCQVGATAAPTIDCAAFEEERNEIRTMDTISQSLGALGIVSAGAAIYLFLQGPDPYAYEQYKAQNGSAEAAIIPLDNEGWLLSGKWLF
ncbi:PEGA domain-containing protein [Myxococcota bacterium]|nr:PEGA domain-containing protein [Myxococcota bacterium]